MLASPGSRVGGSIEIEASGSSFSEPASVRDQSIMNQHLLTRSPSHLLHRPMLVEPYARLDFIIDARNPCVDTAVRPKLSGWNVDVLMLRHVGAEIFQQHYPGLQQKALLAEPRHLAKRSPNLLDVVWRSGGVLLRCFQHSVQSLINIVSTAADPSGELPHLTGRFVPMALFSVRSNSQISSSFFWPNFSDHDQEIDSLPSRPRTIALCFVFIPPQHHLSPLRRRRQRTIWVCEPAIARIRAGRDDDVPSGCPCIDTLCYDGCAVFEITARWICI